MIERELKEICDELYLQNVLKMTELKLKYSEENFNKVFNEAKMMHPKKR